MKLFAHLGSRHLSLALAGALLLFPFSLLALDPAKSVFQFNCQNWTRQNGFPAEKVATLAQTTDGYLWLGTQNGLFRFDGLEFKAVPIDLPQAQGQDVRKLLGARDGSLWFAINEGEFGNYAGQKFSPIGDDRWARPDMGPATIMEARDGAIWTSGGAGLGRWVKGKPGESFFDGTRAGMVLNFCEGPSGRIWMGGVDCGLAYWADGKFVQISDDALKQRKITALAADSGGHVWVGTEQGLRCYDAKGQPVEIPPLYTEVEALLVDSHGILWIGTTGNGLARYQNGDYTYLKKADGLGSDYILSLLEDSEGSLWVGTLDGLSQLTDLKFPIYSGKEGLIEGSTHAVAASRRGGLWITSFGATYLDGKQARNYTNDLLLTNLYLKRVFEASNGDVYLVDGDKSIDVLSGDSISARYPSQTWPMAFAEDAESVLAAVGDGIFRIQNGKLQPYNYKDTEKPVFYWVNNLCVAKDGAIWVASNNGVFRIKDGHFKQWSTGDGLSGGRVQNLCEDEDGSIWVGLITGLARIKQDQIKNIKRENGLYDDRIYGIVADDQGSFWINSGRGIFRIARQNLNAFADGKAPQIQCDVFDGLESVKFTDRTDQEFSGCKTADGRIWFPNPRGVVMIDPAHFFTNRVAPPVYIHQVRVNGTERKDRQALVLHTEDRTVEFSFTALSYISPKKVRVRYQLEGFDPDWIDAGPRRSVLYSNLKPGDYKFRVQAGNADGVWNRAGDEVGITLPPPFYQTMWFTSLCGLAGALALFGAYRWKVRQMELWQRKLQVENDLLETKVGKRTEELAKANSTLREEIAEREKLHCQLEETSRLAGMAEVATGVLHNVGNVLNSVNVSASLLSDQMRKSKAVNIERVAVLMQEHAENLGEFMTDDPKGRMIPAFMADLARHLTSERVLAVEELAGLQKNIEHIKDIVSMQQNYARVAGVTQIVNVRELVEDALRMNESSLLRHDVKLVREYAANLPEITVDKHKVMQILINLIRNAKYACDETNSTDKRMTVRVADEEGRLKISVVDNGVGIPRENLDRIFNHGFTTRKEGHGFGLHSGALAAREMDGALLVHSDGPGQGATFTLELPLAQKN